MAWDDPVVWALIVGVIVFLFGASKIPSFAKALGQARREFSDATRGFSTNNTTADSTDPLVQAAQREGIDTQGKTKQQIASDLSWKLNKK